MRKYPTIDAYQLMHEGAITLAMLEKAGMRIDVKYLERVREKAEDKINDLSRELRQSEVWKIWKQRFRDKASLGSSMQLGAVLFGDMQLPCIKHTTNEQASTDEEALKATGHPFCDAYIRLQKLKKLHGTYVLGILREVEGEYLHPFFNLHLVVTYRSSSDSPNAQNLPTRNAENAKVIRRAFIPRPGRVLVEIDFSAIEVRISAAYHKDPTMLKYIETGHDMHKDIAAECFQLRQDHVTKNARYAAKNGFVFPEFYGSYYIEVAKSLWTKIDQLKLDRTDGMPMRKHLQQQGIRDYSDFEDHIRGVERRFWQDKFPVYNQWKIDWWNKYQRRGWYSLKTGFVCSGVYRRNEVINGAVQGSAFHCLLWSLIQLHKWLQKNKMETVIIGQIHDSMLLDVVPSELEDVVAKAKQITTVDIRKHWRWIITPLDVEVEASDTNWYEKKPLEG